MNIDSLFGVIIGLIVIVLIGDCLLTHWRGKGKD